MDQARSGMTCDLQALQKGAASGTDAVAAMATDEPEADDAAAEPMDDDGSDAGDAATAMHRGSGGRGKPGKKRVSEEFRQKVRYSLLPVEVLKCQHKGQRCLTLIVHIHVHRMFAQLRSAARLRAQVLDILQQNGFEDARVAKMGQDDILRLLACFNAAGIHFA
jgi:hypothetical protein